MISAFINPRKILTENLELKRSMSAADFGCGAGEWTIILAEIMASGKVYAIDLLEEPLSAVRSKARIKKLDNVEIVKSDIEKTISRLKSNFLDLVLLVNVLFQAKDRKSIFEEAKRVLKAGGKVLAIDWSADASIGPAQKVSPEELKIIAQEADFILKSEFKAGNFHFGMVFEKK